MCGVLSPLPVQAREISSSVLDWAGSGVRDTSAVIYETAPNTADYRLRVERDNRGSEFAIVMTSGADVAGSGPPATGEPAVLAPVQVNGTSAGPNPEELLVRVGIVDARVVNNVRQSSGYNLAVFRNDGNGCLSRFRDAGDAELSLPVRAGGAELSGLACVTDPSSAAQFLVRTSATRLPGGGVPRYRTHDVELGSGGSVNSPAGSGPDQLRDLKDTVGQVTDRGGSPSALLRYSSVTGCNLNGEDGTEGFDGSSTSDPDPAADGVGD